MSPAPDPLAALAGLCAGCQHARRVTTPRSVFLRCARAATDPAFARYPRLPVRECPGYTPGGAGAAPPGESAGDD